MGLRFGLFIYFKAKISLENNNKNVTCQFIFLTADFVSLFKVLISGLMTWFNIYIYILRIMTWVNLNHIF